MIEGAFCPQVIDIFPEVYKYWAIQIQNLQCDIEDRRNRTQPIKKYIDFLIFLAEEF